MTFKLEIEGMSCDHCIKFLSTTFSEATGIDNAEVSLNSAIVYTDDSIDEASLKELVEDAGFELKNATKI